MMKMTHCHLTSLLVVGVALCSVACTGDPTSGGIFWSESKARARQESLTQEMNARSAIAQQEESTKATLLAKRKQLQQARKRLAELNQSATPADAAECARLEQQIRQYELDISVLRGD